MSLVQTLNDLTPPDAVDQIDIEPTGCLSNCGKGPNICIGDTIVHGVVNAASAAAELDLSDHLSTHPTLLAAVNVMEKAELGKSTIVNITSNKTAVSSRVAWRNYYHFLPRC